MKTWTMPHVTIEAFVPNEYVAVCKDSTGAEATMSELALNNYPYWDAIRNSHYDAGEEFTVVSRGSIEFAVNADLGYHDGWFYKAYGSDGKYSNYSSMKVYVYAPGKAYVYSHFDQSWTGKITTTKVYNS